MEFAINSDDDSDDDDINCNDDDNKKIFKVLQPETWPTKEELNFNESQYEAYRLALTHEFAVIQGPPGTGKTYIGIHVAKTLLHNVKPDNNCLMLIICYTNHALDQFLEAISKITKSIVRIGSQSRNNALDEFNLTNLRRTSPSHTSAHSFYIDQKIILKKAIDDLQEALTLLDILNKGVVSYKYLKETVPELELLDRYYKNIGLNVEDPLKHWLFENHILGYHDLRTSLLEYDKISNDEEDVDKKRSDIVLDDENLSHNRLEAFKKETAAFLLSDAKLELKNLVSHYKKGRNFNEKYNLQMAIQDVDARINLYNVSYIDVSIYIYLFLFCVKSNKD